MFEKHNEQIISRQRFMLRMLASVKNVLLITALSLAVGIAGYHYTEQMAWIDALLNASMILGGMGPVDTLHTVSGKLFASFYALYSGLFIIALMGILLSPVVHRLLHHFHSTNNTKKKL